MIELMLTAEQQKIVEQARATAAILRRGAAEADRTRTFPSESINALRPYYSLLTPRGTAPSMLNYALVMSELAKGDASIALGLCMHHFVMGELSRPEVPKSTRDTYLNLGRTHLFCALISEPGSSSSDVTSFLPTDVKVAARGDKLVLNGRKHFATFFGIADHAMVFAHRARTESTVACLVVPTRDITVVRNEDIWFTHGMRATMSNPVTFNGTQVPKSALLYETPDYFRTVMFESGIRTFGYMTVYQGIGERLLEVASRSLGNRRVKNSTLPVGADPVAAVAVGDCAGRLEASRLTMLAAMASYDTFGPSPQTLKAVLVAKQVIGETVDHVAKTLRVHMGAHGLLTADSPATKDNGDGEFERLMRDAATAGIMPPSTPSCQRELGYMTMEITPGQRS